MTPFSLLHVAVQTHPISFFAAPACKEVTPVIGEEMTLGPVRLSAPWPPWPPARPPHRQSPGESLYQSGLAYWGVIGHARGPACRRCDSFCEDPFWPLLRGMRWVGTRVDVERSRRMTQLGSIRLGGCIGRSICSFFFDTHTRTHTYTHTLQNTHEENSCAFSF